MNSVFEVHVYASIANDDCVARIVVNANWQILWNQTYLTFLLRYLLVVFWILISTFDNNSSANQQIISMCWLCHTLLWLVPLTSQRMESWRVKGVVTTVYWMFSGCKHHYAWKLKCRKWDWATKGNPKKKRTCTIWEQQRNSCPSVTDFCQAWERH